MSVIYRQLFCAELCVFNYVVTGPSYITRSAIPLLGFGGADERDVIFEISNSCDLRPPTPASSFTPTEGLVNITSSPKQHRYSACHGVREQAVFHRGHLEPEASR